MQSEKCINKNNFQFPIDRRGFTLIELLIAIAISSVVGMAGVAIFSTSNWSYKVNENVSEAQQNVRVAMEWVSKDIRTAGFGLPDPPFSLTFDNLPNPLTSPVTVTTSGGTTDPDSITILGIGYVAGTLQQGGDDTCNGDADSKICLGAGGADDFSTGSGFQKNRRYISLNGVTFRQLADTQNPADVAAGKLTLASTSTLDNDYPDKTPVYIIQAITYSIATDLVGCSNVNPCLASADYTMLRGGSTPGARQVIAENVEDIQFAYGVDADLDGKMDVAAGFQNTVSDPTGIVAVRTTVVAKTRNPDMKSSTFTRPLIEDHSASSSDKYRRRILTKILKLRNPRTGG